VQLPLACNMCSDVQWICWCACACTYLVLLLAGLVLVWCGAGVCVCYVCMLLYCCYIFKKLLAIICHYFYQTPIFVYSYLLRINREILSKMRSLSNQLFLQIQNSGADFFNPRNIQYFSIGVKNHYISAEHVVLT